MSDSKQTEAPAPEQTLLPPVDVAEDAGGITLFADLPGVPKDKLRLHVEVDTLTIEGDIELGMPEGMEPTHAEVGLPRYRRAFTLSKELDIEQVSAEF
jgi:HSP20 family molecular chaperone IbpA